MKLYCPQCQKKYEGEDLRTCPDDGARLYSLAEKRKDPLLGTVLDDRFRVEELLNTGGMGAVYRATQLSVNREVALKVLRPELVGEERSLERFFREAQVVAELSHPNIVRLIDFGQDRSRNVLYLVMELVRGDDLNSLISRGRLQLEFALEVVYQLCGALTEPHSLGVVHRDLKPENIVILPISDGSIQVKVLDFGIARTLESGTQLTRTGMICGTPSYMSPEQAQNHEIDHRTDLYALGILLFEMVSGHLPFASESGLQLLLHHIQRPAPRLAELFPEEIPLSISLLVDRLLAKKPEARPQSALELRREVQKLRQNLQLPPFSIQPPSSKDDDPFADWILPRTDPKRLPYQATPISPAVGGVIPPSGEFQNPASPEAFDDTRDFDSQELRQGATLSLDEAIPSTVPLSIPDHSAPPEKKPSSKISPTSEDSPPAQAETEESPTQKPLLIGLLAMLLLSFAVIAVLLLLPADSERAGAPGDDDALSASQAQIQQSPPTDEEVPSDRPAAQEENEEHPGQAAEDAESAKEEEQEIQEARNQPEEEVQEELSERPSPPPRRARPPRNEPSPPPPVDDADEIEEIQETQDDQGASPREEEPNLDEQLRQRLQRMRFE